MKEWYLIGSPIATSGGFEDESFNGFKDNYMDDILDTELAVTVTKYNYDMSESEEIKAVIQDNLADTYLKSVNRVILTPIGTLTSGDYIEYEGEYWLVIGRPGNNKWYEKAVMVLCQSYIKWQKSDGTIVTRWSNFSSASKYDIGEGGNSTIFFESNNFIVMMPLDPDTVELDDKRVFIDVKPDFGLLPMRVFKVTRNDDVLYNYHAHGRIVGLIVDRDELNLDTDNQELGICDYIAPVLPPVSPSGDAVYELHLSYRGRNSVVAGGNSKKFTCYALSSSDNPVEMRSLRWTVTTATENEDFVHYTVNDDLSISIRCDKGENVIGTQFLLTATLYDHTVSEYIEIGGGI